MLYVYWNSCWNQVVVRPRSALGSLNQVDIFISASGVYFHLTTTYIWLGHVLPQVSKEILDKQ